MQNVPCRRVVLFAVRSAVPILSEASGTGRSYKLEPNSCRDGLLCKFVILFAVMTISEAIRSELCSEDSTEMTIKC